ncbi:MAG: diadenylate cyclase CdaA [Lachnospiraceae bacterium]|nr:diadenylate cyclase CdaA [Lachnospiraceae bacterium]
MGLYSTTMDWRDLLEILILAVLVYYFLSWLKTTRAWELLKGVIVILVFLFIAGIAKLTTILWLARNILQFAAIALIVVLQPEIRRAIEMLGKKNIVGTLGGFNLFDNQNSGERYSDKTINEIVKACVRMAKVKTGALIVIEREESLEGIEETGIRLDAEVTSELLINVFEKNTPLHDGAVVIKGNRLTTATCYLPLTNQDKIGKELGTRHRAGIGVSEALDCVVVIVSEETGFITLVTDGRPEKNLGEDELRGRLYRLLSKKDSDSEDAENGKKKKRKSKHSK